MNLFIVNILIDYKITTYLAAGETKETVEKMFYNNMSFDLIAIYPLLDEIQNVMRYENDKYYLIGRID